MRRSHLWISLIAGLGVWGAYFGHVVTTVRAGDTQGLVWAFLGALVALVAIEAVATGLIARVSRRRETALRDGPDMTATLKASHVALMVLIGLALLGAALLASAAAFGWSLDLAAAPGQIVAANALLAAVVLAELTRAGLTLALLPRR